ncbi:MAG: serine/threonine-protein kinase [Planctomycetota bacterium]
MTPYDDRPEDDRGPDDESIREALERAEGEARPRQAFRDDLRSAFLDGDLEPSIPSVDPVPGMGDPVPHLAPAPVHGLPRWVAWPLAAGVAAAAFFASGLYPFSDPVDRAPTQVADTESTTEQAAVRAEPTLAPEEQAWVDAENAVKAIPALAARPFKRHVAEGRPYLITSEAAFGDLAPLETLSLSMAEADALVAAELAMEDRADEPARVAVIAPDRATFVEIVEPYVHPVPVAAHVAAYDLREKGVLLLSPEVLDEEGPPCDEMDIIHESVHGWLQARMAEGAALPLWVEEGIADVTSQAFADMSTRRWSHRMLEAMKPWSQVDPFTAQNVLAFAEYTDMAQHVKDNAFCEQRPFTFLPAFHAQADSLVLFLTETDPDTRVAFLAMVRRMMNGESFTVEETAESLGYIDAASLFSARNRWIHTDHPANADVTGSE